ncbi:hypothetical protein RJ639_044700 [Escallonia herrerae]|uniref:C2H2-type domain-containing protein n=1 Tax=Escallonia herrerae TaxID=1293975 RepID=A0AA88WAG6_9ASTE|nr:hypothetical protein RJ639_044700 [Escallonia herrerae]
MDSQAKKKALYRAKLNAQKQEKRIESPLVRYNESDQPVCRVCNVVLKSEAAWPAHQLSRQHHEISFFEKSPVLELADAGWSSESREAIKNVKASAAGVSRINSGKQESTAILPKPKAENSLGSCSKRPEPSVGLPKPQPSSVLPSNFFDNHETKRQKNGKAKCHMWELRTLAPLHTHTPTENKREKKN